MEPESFVLAAVFLLLVTSVTVALSKRFGLGSVIGLLVAGVILGPHSLGPALTHNVEGLRHFTELGVVLLLFVIGLELQPARLAAMRREVFGVGSLQIALTGAAVTAYALLRRAVVAGRADHRPVPRALLHGVRDAVAP